MTDSTTFTIERILKQNFARAPNSQDFDKFISKEALSLMVVDRMDKNLAYVTDGVHTIMVLHSSRQQEIFCYPLNRLATRHYTYEPKVYTYLNFTKLVDAPKSQMHPYSPHYFFREEYQNFLQFRETYKLKSPSQMISIQQWNLALVNINSSGYYAPIIVIRKQRKEQSAKPPNYLSLNCVLYEEWLQKQMEAYRLEDIRRIWQTNFPAIKNLSLFYFLRHTKKTNSMAKHSSLVAMDFDQNLLKYSLEGEKHLVLIGHLKGTISFVNSVKNQINDIRMEKMNLKNIELLFNGLSINENEMKERADRKQPVLWSDSEESEADEDPNSVANNTDAMAGSSDEEGDPLKNIYIKSLKDRHNQAA